MKKLIGLLVTGAALASPLAVHAQAPDAPLVQDVVPAASDTEQTARSLIMEAMAADGIPGMSVAVFRGDEMVWNEGIGLANVELQAPVTTATLFRTGSVAKAITGTIAARLADRGEIDLDRPVGDYLSEWPDKHPPITMRQLLGHLGGIRHYQPSDFDYFGEGSADFALYPDRSSILALFAEDPLVAQPGEKYNYSTFGFTLASLAMEAATGKSFRELLRDEVAAPFGLEEIRLETFGTVVPNRTSFYDPISEEQKPFFPGQADPEALPLSISIPFNPAYKYAGGGMLVTARAIGRFGTMHYAPGDMLSDEAFALAMTPQKTNTGEEVITGLAWGGRDDRFGRYVVGHSGSQQGTRAILMIYPEERLTIALLSNLGNAPADISTLGARIADLFLGGTGILPVSE